MTIITLRYQLIIILTAIFSCQAMSVARPTLVLGQVAKTSGDRNVYLNDKGLLIDNYKQNVQIFYLPPNPNIYYINVKQKKYFVTDIDHIPKPQGCQLLKLSFDNGHLIDQPECWILHGTKNGKSTYYFKYNPANKKEKNKVGDLILGHFPNLNPFCLSLLNKITYTPNLKNVVLEMTLFNQNANQEKYIITKSAKTIDYTIKLPDLKAYTKASDIKDFFGYQSANKIIDGFMQFCH